MVNGIISLMMGDEDEHLRIMPPAESKPTVGGFRHLVGFWFPNETRPPLHEHCHRNILVSGRCIVLDNLANGRLPTLTTSSKDVMPWLELKCGEPRKIDGDGGGGDGGPTYRTCLLLSRSAAFEEVRPLKSQNMVSASKLSRRIARTTRVTFVLKQG